MYLIRFDDSKLDFAEGPAIENVPSALALKFPSTSHPVRRGSFGSTIALSLLYDR